MKRNLFLLFLLVSISSAKARIVLYSGSCGESLSWSVYDDGTLSIGGEGDMTVYGYGEAPWCNYEINQIEILPGVTSVCDNAFVNCSEVTLMRVYCASFPDFGAAFKNLPYGLNVYVPLMSKLPYLDYKYSVQKGNGKCGDDLYFTFNNGVLTIFGSGEMYDFIDNIGLNVSPWYEIKDEIKELRFEGDVTSIGNYAFYECINLSNSSVEEEWQLSFPKSVIRVGDYAFYRCDLKSLYYPNLPVEYFGKYAFAYNNNLTEVHIVNTNFAYSPEKWARMPYTIGEGCFSDCPKLSTFEIVPNYHIGNWAFTRTNLSEFGLTNVLNAQHRNPYANGEDATYGILDGAYYLYIHSSQSYVLICTPPRKTSINFPASLKSLESFCFHNTDVERIDIPDGTNTLNDFTTISSSYDKLKYIRIPSSVEKMGIGCLSALAEGGVVRMESSIPATFINNIGYSNSTHYWYWDTEYNSVIIPYGSYEAYHKAKGWDLESDAFIQCREGHPYHVFVEEKNNKGKLELTFHEYISPVQFEGVIMEEGASLVSLLDFSECELAPNMTMDYLRSKVNADCKIILKSELVCAVPDVTIINGKLHFTCDTSGAKFHYSIEAPDINHSGETDGDVTLSDMVKISVYATAEGHKQSETITKTIPLTIGMFGDLNGDGKVNVADLSKFVEYLNTK